MHRFWARSRRLRTQLLCTDNNSTQITVHISLYGIYLFVNVVSVIGGWCDLFLNLDLYSRLLYTFDLSKLEWWDKVVHL